MTGSGHHRLGGSQVCHQFSIISVGPRDVLLLSALRAPVRYDETSPAIYCSYGLHHAPASVLPVPRIDINVHGPKASWAVVGVTVAYYKHAALYASEVLLITCKTSAHKSITWPLCMSAGIGIFRKSFEPKRPEGHQISSFAKVSGAIPDSAIPAHKFI